MRSLERLRRADRRYVLEALGLSDANPMVLTGHVLSMGHDSEVYHRRPDPGFNEMQPVTPPGGPQWFALDRSSLDDGGLGDKLY